MVTSLYAAANLDPAYHLRYAWTGWPSAGALPSQPGDDVWADLLPRWEGDGLRLLEHRWPGDRSQLLFSARPEVSPVFLAARAKGRLQHALRTVAGTPCDFSRKVAVRSVGDNRIRDVQEYVAGQSGKEPCVDPRFRDTLGRLVFRDAAVDPSAPSETNSGRYWYNLHIVLVVERRYRVVDADRLACIRDAVLRAAREGGHRVSVLAPVSDHLHVALRGNIRFSPQEIALACQNAAARAVGCALWSFGYYAGTFGSYDMEAIRRNLALSPRESPSPAAQGGGGRGMHAPPCSPRICFTRRTRRRGSGGGPRATS